jgi:hypothetical protein
MQMKLLMMSKSDGLDVWCELWDAKEKGTSTYIYIYLYKYG